MNGDITEAINAFMGEKSEKLKNQKFSIPAFILSNKAKGLGKNRLSLGIYIVSLLLIVASLLYAVISLI